MYAFVYGFSVNATNVDQHWYKSLQTSLSPIKVYTTTNI